MLQLHSDPLPSLLYGHPLTALHDLDEARVPPYLYPPRPTHRIGTEYRLVWLLTSPLALTHTVLISALENGSAGRGNN